jgi:hypothetical protein
LEGLLVHFGELLDRVVHEVFQFRGRLSIVMKELQELTSILFAVVVSIGLVQELKGLDEDLEAFLNSAVMGM